MAPVVSFHDHCQPIVHLIERLLELEEIRLADFQIDERSSLRGYIAGVLHFEDGSQLHFREFVDVALPRPRNMYAYHYQNQAGQMIFRYDNALHRPTLLQRDHKHLRNGQIELTTAPTLIDIVNEILDFHSPFHQGD
jgi:hypothetical protein